MAQLLDFESNGGRTSTGLEGSPGGVPLLSFCLIGEAVPDSGNGEEKAPVLGNRFDLLPHLCTVDVQAVYSGVRMSAPWFIDRFGESSSISEQEHRFSS